MVTVIGNTLFRTKKIIIETYGNEKFDKILALLPEASRSVFSSMIVSTNQYDLKIYQDFLDAVYKVLGKSDFIIVHETLSEQQLSGLFGFFVKFVSVDTVINRAPAMWSKVFSEGKLEVLEADDKHEKMMVSNFTFTETHLISFQAIISKMVTILKKRNCTSSYKRIDSRTTELVFIVE